MATKRETITGVVLDERIEFSLTDVCRACSMQTEWIVTLVDEGVLEPRGGEQNAWRFTATQMLTAQRISRLQRDLGVNLAGAALALELIDEIAALRERLARLTGTDT